MIVFNGDVSQKCIRWMSNYLKVIFILSFLFGITIVSIPLILLCIYWDWIWVILIVVCYAFLLGVILLMVMFPDKFTQSPPINVSIIKDTLIVKVKLKNGTIVKYGGSMENVKKVVDYGEWYFIVFYFPHKNPFFVCQKDLITEGTIEEFEELFADKIVRKIQKGDNGHEKI